MKTELSLRQVLSVRCPTCRAIPKEKCTLSTGHPSVKTHLARTLAAAKVLRPENIAQAVLRLVKRATSFGFRVLFHRK